MRRLTATALALAAMAAAQSCEIINPDEPIPSYIQIDSLAYEGLSPTGFTCAYVYVDGNLLGIYETPRLIPALAWGESEVSVLPGLSLDGSSFARPYYQMARPHRETVTLTAGEVTRVSPRMQDYPSVQSYWSEDFESSAISLEAAPTAPQLQVVRHDRPGRPGQVGFMGIGAADTLAQAFDYLHYDSVAIPSNGQTAYFEFTYRTNVEMELRAQIFQPTTGELRDMTIMIVYASGQEWRRAYIDFAAIAGQIGRTAYYKPYFRLRREADMEGDSIKAYLDDIRIAHR